MCAIPSSERGVTLFAVLSETPHFTSSRTAAVFGNSRYAAPLHLAALVNFLQTAALAVQVPACEHEAIKASEGEELSITSAAALLGLHVAVAAIE